MTQVLLAIDFSRDGIDYGAGSIVEFAPVIARTMTAGGVGTSSTARIAYARATGAPVYDHEARVRALLLPASGGVSLTASASSYPASASAGTLIANLSDPFAGLGLGSTAYAAFGSVPAQLALDGATVKAGASVATAGSTYSLGVLATSGDGRRKVGETLTFAAAGSAPIDSSLLPVGSRTVFYGDGIASTAAAGGEANAPMTAMALMGGRLRGTVGMNQCRSGGDMDTTYARRDYAALQKADLVVVTSMGHNPEIDGSGALLGVDPSVNPVLINKWKRNVQYQFDNLAPSARMVVWTTCYSSGGSEPFRAQVIAAQQAFVASLGPRVTIFNAHAVYDPVTMSNDGIHPNEKGGLALGTALAAVMDGVVTTASRDAILGQVTAAGDFGANLHPDYAMTGTTGAKTGTVAPTGNYATGQAIVNNLVNGSGMAVACSKDASPGTYEKQVTAVSGTPSVHNTISQQDAATIALTGCTRGDYIEYLCELIIDNGAGGTPVGLHSWSAAPGSFGLMGNSGYNPNFADRAAKLDVVVRTVPLPIFGSASPVANAAILTRWNAVALTGRTILSRQIVRKVELLAYAAPLYLGGDGDTTSNYLCRITGTATVGSTLSGEPGKWSGGALSHPGQWYRNGVAISGATGFTYVVQGADSGTTLTWRPLPTNSFGSETTTSSAGVAVA